MEFFYDITGLLGFTYGNYTCFYRKDIQGNIIALVNEYGQVITEYKYNAWGEQVISGSNTTLGNLNPFRYRGYYYDTETGLYYLQTRYYDPEVGRFINIDNIDYADPKTLTGLNLYAYCNNNPVMYADPTGHYLLFVFLVLLAGAVIGGAVAGVDAAKKGETGWAFAGKIFLGIFAGIAVAGAVLMLLAPFLYAIEAITIVTATRIFALGIAAFNLLPMVVAPIMGEPAKDPIEYNPNPYAPITMPPYTTMSTEVKSEFKSSNLEYILKIIRNFIG